MSAEPGYEQDGPETVPGLSVGQRDALTRLAAAWSRYPALRLGQLIGNVHRFEMPANHMDPYYLSDEEFVGAIEPLTVTLDDGGPQP